MRLPSKRKCCDLLLNDKSCGDQDPAENMTGFRSSRRCGDGPGYSCSPTLDRIHDNQVRNSDIQKETALSNYKHVRKNLEGHNKKTNHTLIINKCSNLLTSSKSPSICRVIPSTFPTIFTHFYLILLSMFVILSSLSSNPRQHKGAWPIVAPPIGGWLLLADAYSSTYNAKDFSRNVTQLLENLMGNYDKTLRPGHGGPPTSVIVNMNVRSMGSFSEKEEEYSMQLYLRQIWYDSRLKFNKTDLGRSEFSMNWVTAQRIWKPDTFFINGKESYAHSITAPNLFIRLQYDGQIYMSMRLTVRASCNMHLRRFPLDTQTCPLRLSSFSYNSKDIVYRWDQKKLVSMAEVSLAQYEMTDILTSEAVVPVRRIEEISTLTVKFVLIRLTGFYILQVYVPCLLIVCSSWVGFWITKKDAPGRVCLGVNNVLCMTKLGFGGRSIFPEVSYPTALDYFVLLCFWFTFATMIEYAAINYFQRYAVTTLNRLIKRKQRLKLEAEFLVKIAAEGAGCIKIIPCVHTSILETFRLHLVAAPYVVNAAYTAKPKTDTKDNLLQALRLPLTAVPKAAEEADKVNKAKIQFGSPEPKRRRSSIVSSETESETSLSPKHHTPRLLHRLAHLRRTSFSSIGIHEEDDQPEASTSTSPQLSPQPSLLHLAFPTRPLPPTPDGPPQTPSPGSTVSLPSPGLTIFTSEQETPQISPMISPLMTPQSSPPSLTITTSPQEIMPIDEEGTEEEDEKGTTPAGIAGMFGGISGGDGGPPVGPTELPKPSGTILKVEEDEKPSSLPPPSNKHTVTIWQLLIRKKMLMKKMTPNYELPNEEDLLDKFNIIDIYSRRIFPSLFFIIFSIYWILFNYYISDEFPHEPKVITDGLIN